MKIMILILLFLAALEDIKRMEVMDIYPASIFIISIANIFANPHLNTKLVLINSLVVFMLLLVYWFLGAVGGADVKILTALSLFTGLDIWKLILVSSLVFVFYSLILRKFRDRIPFMPSVFIGSLIFFH
ncbi:Type IV leader peptidase family protein [Thermoanaerobacter thermohydrosulfuricus]|nr:Type IV leader peptidase family protein [Thermoanaerobacter thermohydrosulfuricus]